MFNSFKIHYFYHFTIEYPACPCRSEQLFGFKNGYMSASQPI